MPSIFSKIINGELPSVKVFENDLVVVIMDIFPLRKGHTLVIPKVEVDKIYDLENNYYQELFKVAKEVSVAMEKSIDCERVAISVIGLEVPHAHIHLIPINEVNDTNFVQPKLETSKEELIEIAEKIKSNL